MFQGFAELLLKGTIVNANAESSELNAAKSGHGGNHQSS